MQCIEMIVRSYHLESILQVPRLDVPHLVGYINRRICSATAIGAVGITPMDKCAIKEDRVPRLQFDRNLPTNLDVVIVEQPFLHGMFMMRKVGGVTAGNDV